MTHLLLVVGWNTCLAALVAVVVWFACRTAALRRRPALCHALWLLVLVKLVTPPLVPLPLLPAAPRRTCRGRPARARHDDHLRTSASRPAGRTARHARERGARCPHRGVPARRASPRRPHAGVGRSLGTTFR